MDQGSHENGAGGGSAGGTTARLSWELDGDVWHAASAAATDPYGVALYYQITAGTFDKGTTTYELGGDAVPQHYQGRLAHGAAGLELLREMCQAIEAEHRKAAAKATGAGTPRLTGETGGEERRSLALGPETGGGALGGSGGSAPQAASNGQAGVVGIARAVDAACIHSFACGMVHGGRCTCGARAGEFAGTEALAEEGHLADEGRYGPAGAGTPSLALGAPKDQGRASLLAEAKRAYGNYRAAAGLLRVARVELVAQVLGLLRGGEQSEWAGLLRGVGIGDGEVKSLVDAVMKEL